VACEIVNNAKEHISELKITLNKQGWIIKGILAQNETLFKVNGGTYVQILSTSEQRVVIPLSNEKN